MTAQGRIIARWPEMLVQRDAAEYCSLSIAAFEREVSCGRLPSPVRIGGKDRWRRTAIDRALDVITGDASPSGDEAPWRREMRERYGRKNAQA